MSGVAASAPDTGWEEGTHTAFPGAAATGVSAVTDSLVAVLAGAVSGAGNTLLVLECLFSRASREELASDIL